MLVMLMVLPITWQLWQAIKPPGKTPVNKSSKFGHLWPQNSCIILSRGWMKLRSEIPRRSDKSPRILQLRPSKAQPGKEKAYRLSDVDVDHRRGAEWWRASIPGLDHQWPLAVLLLGDVVHNLHGLDVRLQPDLSSVGADFKGAVGVGPHDGVFNDVVWRFSIFVQCLEEKTSTCIKYWAAVITKFYFEGYTAWISSVVQYFTVSQGHVYTGRIYSLHW